MKAFGNVNGDGFLIYEEGHAGDNERVVLDVLTGAFALVNQTSVNGKSVLSLPDGRVLSIDPQGYVETRAPGTSGPWEQGVVDGGIITYTPDPSSGLCFPFGLKDA